MKTIKKAKKVKTIAILTSGGDGPGMNSAIRAVVRTAIGVGLKVWGINKGYSGLLEGDMYEMDIKSVSNIIQKGGTILQTSRCKEFMHKEIRKEAANILKRKKIDALIVIGGNGSFNGAMMLYKENAIPVVGIPGSIDNDISGTEYSIGFDTAVQTAVEAVDKIRDTASSHARIFIVEVMGRNAPAIALHVGICTGAEYVAIPSKKINIEEIAEQIERGVKRGKTSSIIIVAEGDVPGYSYDIQRDLQEKFSFNSHVCILGHIQRGGIPTPTDRFIASAMGNAAVMAIMEGKAPSATAYVGGKIVITPLKNCLEKKNDFDQSILNLAKKLAI